MDMRTKCMQFLYKWVTEGKLPNIRKNQVEELEAFVNNEISQREINQMTARMEAERIAASTKESSSQEEKNDA